MDETFLLQPALCARQPMHSTRRADARADWAYLENWCRGLTGAFKDVYVFTVPLYIPAQGADGKWRVVRAAPSFPGCC
jgi:hypothetical protein